MTKSIAFFDFDGTITSKNTLPLIIQFQRGKWKMFTGFIVLLPILISYKLRLLSAEIAKEHIFKYFFENMPFDIFQEKCDRFGIEILPGLIRPAALSVIQSHAKNGVRVIVVSASAENWISCWCQNAGVEYIGTKLEVVDKKMTGRIEGRNCNGDEKVRRINECINLKEYHKIFAYGNSKGDNALLDIATHPFYKHF